MASRPEPARVQVSSLLAADQEPAPGHHEAQATVQRAKGRVTKVQDVLNNAGASSSGKSREQQLDFLLNELAVNAPNTFSILDGAIHIASLSDLALPPKDCHVDAPSRAARSGAPLVDVLNAETDGCPNGQSSSRTAAVSQIPGQIIDQLAATRKHAEGESRVLPRPARKLARKQGPGLLPPLLAPLHDPPVDARVVPSMNTERAAGTLSLQASIGGENVAAAAAHPVTLSSSTVVDNSNTDGVIETEGSAPASLTPDQKSGSTKRKRQPRARDGAPKRLKWTAAETQCLIDGVKRFGIGCWKQILQCEEYSLQETRTAVDLKDRFRVCYPKQYGAGAASNESVLSETLINKEPFQKSDRRPRQAFTATEDEALLLGFLRHSFQWKKIQMDGELGLTHRTRTDLRDRFRNCYPQHFKNAGKIHKAKQSSGNLMDAPAADVVADVDEALTISPSRARLSDAGMVMNTMPLDPSFLKPTDEPMHSLRLFSGGLADPFDLDFLTYEHESDHDTEMPSIHLNRSIFDWADQNKLQSGAVDHAGTSSREQTLIKTSGLPAAAIAQAHDPGNEVRRTISGSDFYYLNPVGARSTARKHGADVEASLPLSRILNETGQ